MGDATCVGCTPGRFCWPNGIPQTHHTLSWDGAGVDGRRLPRGVYFAKIRLADSGVEAARRIVVLR